MRRWNYLPNGMPRVCAYIEPRDLWIGAYVARDAVYICPLPCVVIRIRRGAR